MTYEVRRAIQVLERRYSVRVVQRGESSFSYRRTLASGAVVVTTCSENALLQLATSAEVGEWAEMLQRQQEGAQS